MTNLGPISAFLATVGAVGSSMIGGMDRWVARVFLKGIGLWLLVMVPTQVALATLNASRTVIQLVFLALFVLVLSIVMSMYTEERKRHPEGW